MSDWTWCPCIAHSFFARMMLEQLLGKFARDEVLVDCPDLVTATTAYRMRGAA
jgi:hypothetical protein